MMCLAAVVYTGGYTVPCTKRPTNTLYVSDVETSTCRVVSLYSRALAEVADKAGTLTLLFNPQWNEVRFNVTL